MSGFSVAALLCPYEKTVPRAAAARTSGKRRVFIADSEFFICTPFLQEYAAQGRSASGRNR
jgi:hypothetical protein